MLIRLGNKDREVRRVLYIVVAVAGESAYISAAGLDLNYVGNGLFIKRRLCQNADHQSAVLDEADGTVLQLAGSIGFGMDIGYLLKLKRTLHAAGIIHTPAKVKYILC